MKPADAQRVALKGPAFFISRTTQCRSAPFLPPKAAEQAAILKEWFFISPRWRTLLQAAGVPACWILRRVVSHRRSGSEFCQGHPVKVLRTSQANPQWYSYLQ